MNKKQQFIQGFQHGIPIGLGYFAVAFSLGVAAKHAGLNAFQGFLASILNNASAGEYAGFTVIAAHASYFEMAIIILVTNARYMLMSCALSQHLPPTLSLGHRLLIGHFVTDEIFGITIARPGTLNPYYTYGAAIFASPAWAIGTALGIMAGNLLPLRVVSALSVALFGMFLAVFIPPCKHNPVIAGCVISGFGLSYLMQHLGKWYPFFGTISGGTKTIILTVLISALAAVFFPISEKE
ncbi:MAG: AzlC family ABC transporter permease [Lachnospiraceae bacterium]|nr:AzlC family ABC transporter permease [Lachnospiraceae bacterium]